jgi:hypothetical protein
VKIVNFIIGLFFFPFLIIASENENNLTWIENNLNSIFDSLGIAQYSVLKNTELDFGKVNGEKFGFIKNQVIKYFDSKKNARPVERDSVLFRIEQFDINVVYVESSAGFLNLETETVRKNIIHLAGWLETKSDHSVKKSLNINKTFSEKLTTDDISELEQSPYVFTKGKTEKLSLWKNIIEPAMVLTSVAVIVYLFFSVRS